MEILLFWWVMHSRYPGVTVNNTWLFATQAHNKHVENKSSNVCDPFQDPSGFIKTKTWPWGEFQRGTTTKIKQKALRGNQQVNSSLADGSVCCGVFALFCCFLGYEGWHWTSLCALCPPNNNFPKQWLISLELLGQAWLFTDATLPNMCFLSLRLGEEAMCCGYWLHFWELRGAEIHLCLSQCILAHIWVVTLLINTVSLSQQGRFLSSFGQYYTRVLASFSLKTETKWVFPFKTARFQLIYHWETSMTHVWMHLSQMKSLGCHRIVTPRWFEHVFLNRATLNTDLGKSIWLEFHCEWPLPLPGVAPIYVNQLLKKVQRWDDKVQNGKNRQSWSFDGATPWQQNTLRPLR